jgi:hypothetical protein
MDPIQLAGIYVKEDGKQIFSCLQLLLIDLIKLKLAQNNHFLIYANKVIQLEVLAKKFSLVNLFKIHDALSETYSLMIKGMNINLQLALESIFIECNRDSVC